ncbi:MAG: FkbM family methyltransferase [Pedosphaera sp.]|nr:FkbM family methyltransferase [Pedosphaera sp.]
MNLFEVQAAFRSNIINKQQYIEAMHRLHSQLFEYAEFLKGTEIGQIDILDGQVIMETRKTGIKILCDKTDQRIAPIEILNFGAYEKADSTLLFRLLEDHMSIFDIGANIGWYSLNFAKAFPGTTIYAFEPIPATFAQLQANITLNQATSVRPHNFGFSDREGLLTFYFDPRGSGGASAVDLQGSGVAWKVECAVQRLDSFVARTGVHVDLIKCDVEGAELMVLNGGAETLRQLKPIVFTEMLRKWAAKFNYHPNQIIEFMAGLGYRCFVGREGRLTELKAMDENTSETNFFFLHGAAHASKIVALT